MSAIPKLTLLNIENITLFGGVGSTFETTNNNPAKG